MTSFVRYNYTNNKEENKIATTVYSTEEITLEDDTLLVLKPASIKTLRLFMKKMAEFAQAETEDDGLVIVTDAAAILLKKQHPKYWDASLNDGLGAASDEFEEVADIQSIYKVIEVCGGIKLNADPNLTAATTEIIGTN